jgi:hypothetical protein
VSEAVQYLPPYLYVPALTILVSLFGAATAIIAYFLKDFKHRQETKNAEQDRAIEKIKDDIAEFKAALPHNYVLREDFIRSIAGLDVKIDRMARDVANISKTLARLAGGKSDAGE